MSKGFFHDELVDRSHRVLWSGGWRGNAIVESCDRLLAALMKREDGIGGILYLAVGTGSAEWDASPDEPSPATNRLFNERARLPVQADQMQFLNEADAPSETPTQTLEVRVDLDGDILALDGAVPLREFGLFGGDASENADSGLLVNYVIHPRIDLSPRVVLRRRLRLTFASGAAQESPGLEPAPGSPITLDANMPVTSIGGVGEVFGSMLAAEGVHTIGDLVQIDPLVGIGNIPMVLLREFRAKARLALGLHMDLRSFRALWDRNVSEILLESPEVLVQTVGGNRVTVPEVVRLQEQLAFLQIAMVDTYLQRVTLHELAGG